MQTTETVTYDRDGNAVERSTITAPSPASSVEIATDSKGSPKPTVKVYHEDPQEAKQVACQLYAEIIGALTVSALSQGE